MAGRYRDDDPGRALAALHAIDPGLPREGWVRVAMGAKAAGVGEDEFVAWSAQAGNFASAADCKSTWRSISPGGGVGEATLFRLARDAGWRDDGAREPARPRPASKPVARQPEPEPDDGWRKQWESAVPAGPEHPYVVRKRGLPDGLRVRRDGWLMVPLHDADGQMMSWQAISPEPGGPKLSAKGRPMTGWFVVGGPIRDGQTVYIVEGIGQAWSAHQATRAPAVVTFSAGRMQAVAQGLRERFPDASLVLVADAGKERDCEAIAGLVDGLSVGLPAGWPANSDVNDLHLRDGLAAVAELLSQAKQPEKPEPSSGLRAIPAAEFCAAAGTPEYLLDGVLQRGFVYATTGQTGSGKTAVAIALAASMALGRDFAGRETVPASVLYVASENPDDVRARVLAWCATEGVSVDSLSARLHFVDESFILEERHGELLAAIESVEAAVVILDTDQALAGSEDENSNSERIAHAKRVRELSRASSRPCVIDLCHPPAGASRTSLRPRGGSSFLAEIDGNVGLWRDDATGLVELFKTGKFRGPDFEPLVFELREVAVDALRDSKGRPMLSVVAVPASAADDARLAQEGRARLLAVLRDVSADPEASQRQRSESLRMPRTAVQRALLELVEGGALKRGIAGHEVTDKGKKWLVAAL